MCWRPLSWNGPAARQGCNAGACHFDQAQGAHQLGEGLYFFRGSGDFKDKAGQRRIHHIGAEDVGQAQRLDPLVAAARHLEQRQFPLDAGALDGQVVHFVYRHDAAKLCHDLFDHRRGAAGDDGDARAVAKVVDLGHGQAVDVIAAPREQADHPRQHARLVVDHHGQGMAFDHIRVRIAQIIGRMARGSLLDLQWRHGLTILVCEGRARHWAMAGCT